MALSSIHLTTRRVGCQQLRRFLTKNIQVQTPYLGGPRSCHDSPKVMAFPTTKRSISSSIVVPAVSSQSSSRTSMAKTVEQALQEGELFTDNQTYTYLKMPVTSISKATNMVAACSGDFRTLMLDKDEVTLMISSNDYEAHREKLVDDHVEVGRFAYRLITFDVVMDPTLIGFMATVTKALAAAQISVLPFAAYSRHENLGGSHSGAK
jgi:hypothetical protein